MRNLKWFLLSLLVAVASMISPVLASADSGGGGNSDSCESITTTFQVPAKGTKAAPHLAYPLKAGDEITVDSPQKLQLSYNSTVRAFVVDGSVAKKLSPSGLVYRLFLPYDGSQEIQKGEDVFVAFTLLNHGLPTEKFKVTVVTC